ncbi:nucleoporin [Gymnopus androsaceus JB14]|uniref:Nucleoporin n=1 Tax=Gymnopus androsaceus JB14 TaxID=1447944 RepID=A0A6A4IEM8_9AGAR|nr:nucleoporin [Gymnopus androsaceus JB14]
MSSSSFSFAGHSSKQVSSEKVPPIDLSVLQNASKVLEEQFTKDSQAIPELGDTLPSGQASSSYSVFPDDVRVPFQKRKLVGIPEALFQYYSSTSVNSHMGLIPELERVWISIDHKLFLWDYNDRSAHFVDQPYVITHVGLVKPKKGLFIEEISHLLVICTPVSILLIALSFSMVKLYATDLTISTEVEMTSVVGTPDGRIFMCGSQDGNLYELHYQENEGWFGKRIQLINHSVGAMSSLLPRFTSTSAEDRIISVVADSERECFYTLTEKNVISIYKPTSDKSVQHVQTLSNLYKTAQDRCPGSPAITPQTFQIITLHPISLLESRSGVQLLAMTTNGVRLYFSPGFGYGGSMQTLGTRTLQLSHVRLPPSNLIHPDEQENPHRPPPSVNSFGPVQGQPPRQSRAYIVSTIDNSCYVDGLTVSAQPGDVDTVDYLLCMSPDLTRIGSLDQLNLPQPVAQPTYSMYGSQNNSSRPPLTEYATLLSIPGRTWAMAPVPQKPLAADVAGVAVTNELATQVGEPPRQFMILTNVGLTFLVKRRSLDYLRAVIEELQSEGNVQPIIEFRDSFGRNQTCAMLLALASGNTFLDGTDQPSGTISSVSPDLAAVAKQAFYDFGEKPIWSERMVYGKSENQGTAIFSGRREGLALYLSRLVRPIWKSKLVVASPSGLQPAVLEERLISIQKNLYALKDLLDKNPHLFHSSPGDSAASRAPAMEQEAWKAEQASVAQLLSLLTRSIEALSFVLLLNDYRFGDIMTKCDAEIQKLVSSLTFEDLITTQNGLTVSRALVNVIIDQQIGQQISVCSVDTISEVLQNRCGSFCSTDDVMLYKAKENIRKAVETSNPVEKQNWLSESLRLYTKGARILDLEKLREICGDFQLLSYAKGAIELSLICARVFDPDNIGWDYWRSGASSDGPARVAYQRRLQCYELILDSLSVFERQMDDPSAAGTSLSPQELESVKDLAYKLSFSSDDEMFHSTLYDWLISRQLADDLLEIRPPFLESHLRREPVSAEKYQLLWQFYVKDGQPLRAAEVLLALAESAEFPLQLDSRLEYLTLAVGNAKSHPVSAGGRHETAIAFLTDLEEKLEVAQVQLEIYSTLLPHVNDAPEVGARINALSLRLYTLSDLFQEYAIPFDLPILKLLCLHVAEHRDEVMVRQVWNQIFDQVIAEESDLLAQADQLSSRLIKLGRRFYPSVFAFPLQLVADLLVRFSLERKDVLPSGWAPRILVQAGVPYVEIWDAFHEMYESHIPPFNAQANVQAISSDIAILLSDWLEEAKRPNSSSDRGELPVSRIDFAVNQYINELDSDRVESKKRYEAVKRELRRNW